MKTARQLDENNKNMIQWSASEHKLAEGRAVHAEETAIACGLPTQMSSIRRDETFL